MFTFSFSLEMKVRFSQEAVVSHTDGGGFLVLL